jgi:hypothetical protein
LVNFWGSCHERCCHIIRPLNIFYGHLIYFMAIWYILLPFDIFYGHLIYFMAIFMFLLTFYRFGMFYQEYSGNPVLHLHSTRLCSVRLRLSILWCFRLSVNLYSIFTLQLTQAKEGLPDGIFSNKKSKFG